MGSFYGTQSNLPMPWEGANTHKNPCFHVWNHIVYSTEKFVKFVLRILTNFSPTKNEFDMNFNRLVLSVIIAFALNNQAYSQMATPTEEHKVLKKEEGEWKATMTMHYGPAGPMPQPMTVSGSEINQMVGEFWISSSFEVDMGGMPFKGHGTFGYDVTSQKYVGMWVDSMSMHPTKMIGTYDKAKKTMTYQTTGMGMDGKPMKGKNIVVYESDDRRVMTMFAKLPENEKMEKMMEIVYERTK